jgi:short-subunit dehydrogenase
MRVGAAHLGATGALLDAILLISSKGAIMADIDGMRVLVLGANGVLGSQLSAMLTQAGAEVLGTARTAESSSALPSGLVERLLVDLTDEASIETLSKYLVSQGPLGGVVNAAGTVGFGTVAETSPMAAAELMQVNHLGPASLITQVLPALQAAREAGQSPFVLSITGVVAERAFPGMAAYVASKTAHSAWLASVRLELRRSRIRVIDARPGHTETGLAGRARFGQAPAFPPGLAPDAVASVIVQGILGDSTEIASSEFD